MKRVLTILAFVAVLSAVPVTAEAGCSVSMGKIGPWETTIVQNDLVRVVFLPDIGGRIFEYGLKSSGNNHMYNSPMFSDADVMKKVKKKVRETGEYPSYVPKTPGGYEDMITDISHLHGYKT